MYNECRGSSLGTGILESQLDSSHAWEWTPSISAQMSEMKVHGCQIMGQMAESVDPPPPPLQI